MINTRDGYICYIVNPKSGATSSRLISRRFKEYLTENGYQFRVNLTKSLGHACEIATKAAVDYECSMVVAAGGDGTIREVAHGLEGSDKPLLIVPGGTENLLASEVGFDERVGTVIKAFEGKYIKPFDLGKANGKCFTCLVGFGFDGQVVKLVSKKRDGHIDYTDYFWPIWRTFWGHKFERMNVCVDGKEIFDGQGLVFVGNISRYAMGLKILHSANYSDGLLDVCIFKCASQIHLVKHSIMTVLKQLKNASDVVYVQGKHIKVSSESEIVSEMDGDPGPNLPVEIEVIPQAVNLMVPEGAVPAGMRARIIRVFR